MNIGEMTIEQYAVHLRKQNEDFKKQCDLFKQNQFAQNRLNKINNDHRATYEFNR